LNTKHQELQDGSHQFMTIDQLLIFQLMALEID